MDRNRRARTSPATNNRMFHPAGATNFPCARVVLLLADKIRFFATPGHSAGAVLQRTCGPRCRYSIQTTSLSSPVRHEAVRSGAKAHDKIRQRAEHALLLPTVHRWPTRRAIFELAQLHLPDEPIRSSATHKRLRVTYQENPTIPD